VPPGAALRKNGRWSAYQPQAGQKKEGSSLFSVGRLLGGFGLLSATLRLLKVESGINGILPAGGGPLPFIPFLS
jgi:hypothetical protein